MSVIQEVQDLIQGRIKELDDERSQLDQALAKLDGKAPIAGRSRRARHSRKRSRKAGGRAAEAVKLITAKPGISASEIAKAMKIKPNYLYRVLGELEKAGQVKKDGRKYTVK